MKRFSDHSQFVILLLVLLLLNYLDCSVTYFVFKIDGIFDAFHTHCQLVHSHMEAHHCQYIIHILN